MMTTRVPSRASWSAAGRWGAAGEGAPVAACPAASWEETLESGLATESVTPAILPGSGYLRIVSNVNINLSDPKTDPFEVAQQAANAILTAAGTRSVDIALVLGSGWSGAADLLGETIAYLPAGEVPGCAASGVPGHSGTLRVIRYDDGEARHALVLGARTHYYEGRGVRAVAHGMRTAAAAGASVAVLTNGGGGLNPDWAPGSPVLISDHLHLTAAAPLEGATLVDLTDLYSSGLRDRARTLDPVLAEGVYAQFRGPHYETPAEVRMAQTLGADLVGMSTALEAIAAREAGLEVFGMSLVTNLAAGISPVPLSHADVVAAGKAAEARLAQLLSSIVTKAVA